MYWRGVLRRSPGWRRGVIAALSLAFVMSVAMHDTTLLMKGVDAFTAKFGLKRAKDPLRRARGWTDFADHVQRARETHQPTLLLGNHYSQPSMMTFYLPDRPWGYLWPEPFGSSQFSLWPRYTLTPESRALFVTDTDTPVYWYPGMTNEFRKFELVDDFVTQHNGRPMRRFWIWLCTEPNVSAAPPAVPPPVPAP